MSPKEDPPLFTFFNEIGILAQLSSTVFERVLPKGMTVSQFSVLNHLVRRGDGVNPSQIASAFQVTRGAMTNTLLKLERRDAIALRPDERDGRGKKVYLTGLGREVRDQSIAALTPELGRILEDFPADRFREALPLLQELRVWLDADRD